MSFMSFSMQKIENRDNERMNTIEPHVYSYSFPLQIMLNLDDFCVQLPKVELHAHLNGSLSVDTMRELVELKKDMNPELAQFKIPDSLDSIHDFFPIFRFIYQLTDTEESVAIATRNIINEFKADGVRYLELRTTPRKNNETNMTKHTYINTIVNVMQEEREDIIVRLIISVDRSNTLAEAEEVVDLALMFKEKGVVGIDLCGNVSVGLFETLKPAFERAKKHGFSITLHFNEIKENLIEAPSLLSIHPSRLGHATVLDDVSRRFIYENNIPIEVCMTSNIICKTVDKYEEHHLKDLLEHQHPFALCTDDKGVFFSSLSHEYKIAAEVFDISQDELFKLSFRSIDAIFSDNQVKDQLRRRWLEWKTGV